MSMNAWTEMYKYLTTADDWVDYVTRFWNERDAMEILAMMGSPVEVQHLLATHPLVSVRIVLATADGTTSEVGEILKKDQELAVRLVANSRQCWAASYVTLPALYSARVVDLLFNRSKRDGWAAMTAYPKTLAAYAVCGQNPFRRFWARILSKATAAEA